MKHYMTEADLMTLLKSRGLVISDEGKVNILQLIQHVLQWFKLQLSIQEYDGTEMPLATYRRYMPWDLRLEQSSESSKIYSLLMEMLLKQPI